MANPNLYRILGSVSCATLILTSALSAPVQQKQPARIGDYSVVNIKTINFTQKPNGDMEYRIRSLSGSSLQLTSPTYDITAPQVMMLVKAVGESGKPGRSKVTSIDATGNVKVVNRNPTNNQKTVVTGRSVNYSAAADPKDRGILRFSGNVRAEMYGISSAAAPVVLEGETGIARFLPDGSINVVLDEPDGKGKLTGQFYETEQKPKENQ